MISAVRTLAVVLCAGTLFAAVPQNDRVVYVTAVGGNGMPVTDLTQKDFVVMEDNVTREVTGIAKPTEPMYYSVLVDTSLNTSTGSTAEANLQNANNMLPYLRESLSGFVKAVLGFAPDSKIQIMSVGGAATVRQDFTSDLALLDPLVSKIQNVSSEPVVSEGLVEASKLLAKVPSRRRVILSINREPTVEASRYEPKIVAEAVRKGGASLWAISVRYGPRQDANRDELLKKLSPNSGGVRFTLASPLQLGDYLKSVAANTLMQYAVTIKRPTEAPPASVTSVKVNRPGVLPLTLQWSDK